MDQETEIKQQLENEIEMNVNKLLLLIQNSTLSEEIKFSLIEILPEFSLEQIDRLLNILESAYLNEKTKDIDEKMKQDLQMIVEKLKNEDKSEQEKFINQLELLTKEI